MAATAKLSAYADAQPRALAHLTQALQGARQAHAFLLVGGAASHAPQVAWALVSALLCEDRAGRDACGRCVGCRRLEAQNHPGLHTLAPEKTQSVGVGQIRALLAKLALVGGEGKASVVHVPRAARLSLPAQQALLKTLEEPTGATTFVLVAPQASDLLPTLRSRMAVLPLGQRDEGRARQALRQGGVPPHLVDLAALQVGDDVAAAEALVEAGLGQVVERLHEALAAGGDVSRIGRCAQELGQDPARYAAAGVGLALHLRDALLARLDAPAALQRDSHSHALIGHVATNQLCAAVDALQNLLHHDTVNLNRPMALEGLLLLLEQSAAS